MWLMFDASGNLTAFSRGGNAPTGAVVVALPDAVAAAAYRACRRGRVTYDVAGSRVLLDGQPVVWPTSEPTITFTQMLNGIDGLSVPAGAKVMLRRLAELLLEHGKVEL